MTRLPLLFAGLVLCVSGVVVQAQGSGSADGPITAAAYDARAIVQKKGTGQALESWMSGQADSADVITFLRNPLQLLNSRNRIPSRERLKALQENATKDSAKAGGGTVAPAAGATSFALNGGTIIYGVADFVVARAKDELVVVAVDRARDWFARDALLRRLFPNSYDAIQVSGNSTLDGMLQLLRTAGRTDLAALPQLVRDTLRTRCTVGSGTPTCPEKAAVTIDGLVIMTVLLEHTAQGDSPLAVLDSLGTRPGYSDLLLTVQAKRVVRVAGATARECPNANCARLLALLTPDTRRYVGVLFAREAFDSSFTINEADVELGIQQLQSALRDIRAVAADLKGPGPGNAETRAERLVRYATVLDGVAAVAQDGISIASRLAPDGGTQFATIATAVAHSRTLVRAVAQQDYVAIAVQGLAVARDAGAAIPEPVLRWATFGSSLASATSPGEVQLALDNFALPNGSFVAKRTVTNGEHRHLGVYVNSYLGITGGFETLRGGTGATSAFGGVSLPIGLELAYAGSNIGVSLFVPVVDLGAVASYRWSHQDATSVPNVGFSQVIAPGLFLTFSPVRRYPLSVGIGYQYAPQLRNLVTGESVDASRIAGLLSFDVPLFRIH